MITTEVNFFTSVYVDKLYRELILTQDYKNYLKEIFPFEYEIAKGSTGININSDFFLDPDKSDFDNSVHIYETFKHLTEAQASDERFWTYLIHVHCWKYMRKRWAAEDAKEPINRIRDRYFLRTLNLRSLTRNGLSRLWWYAHLTYNKSNKNPYENLELLLSRQDLVVGITERALGSNQAILSGLLEFLKTNNDIAKSEDKTRKLIVGLNLAGGVKMLPFLNMEEIKLLLEKVKENQFT
ncbi:MAG TPA: DUF6339 family protein [Ferruginibacter sp.]|nr:DUF6339 family protein [Ferruginibacter sp.]